MGYFMKKTVLTIVLFNIAASLIFADEQKIITVLDFETSGVSEQEMTLFVDYLSSSVSDYEEYILIDRRQREIILSEAEFSNSGCADESCAIEIGQVLSASEMIVGSLGSIGSRYLLNVKLIDVETGETIRDVSEKYNSIDDLVDGSELVINSLFSEGFEDSVKTAESGKSSDKDSSSNKTINTTDDKKRELSYIEIIDANAGQKTYVYNTTEYDYAKSLDLLNIIMQDFPDSAIMNNSFDKYKRNRGAGTTTAVIGGIMIGGGGIGALAGLPSNNQGLTYGSLFFGVGLGIVAEVIAGILTSSAKSELEHIVHTYNESLN